MTRVHVRFDLTRRTLLAFVVLACGCGRLGYSVGDRGSALVPDAAAQRIVAIDGGGDPEAGTDAAVLADAGGTPGIDSGSMVSDAGAGLDAGPSTDASGADAGNTDAGSAAGCGGPSILLCDDNEVGPVSGFSPLTLDGTVGVDTTQVLNGSRSSGRRPPPMGEMQRCKGYSRVRRSARGRSTCVHTSISPRPIRTTRGWA